MISPDQSNTIFFLAADFINHTSRSVFLTGKAGTGKTTLLKYIRENTAKRTIVVAPTGVAAINAGGVTIHSFFNIPPFGPFIPGYDKKFSDGNVMDKNRLLRNIRYNAEKRELLQDLELMIIDEVSMVRCDLLDAMDMLLRTFRKKQQLPFGGVQVVYIGDLYQLPPVAKNEDWNILKEYYKGPFFFDSRAVSQSPPLYLELKKVYRQNEQQFIDLLNHVRNNEVNEEDFVLLHQRFDPGFNPPAEENFITLTTHNYKADAINQAELKRLPGPLFRFKGTIDGEFPDHVLPAEMELQLKAGAQVMFVRNDTKEGPKKYYNGKIAVVSDINGEEIRVRFPDTGKEMKLEKETWKNMRYAYNREEEMVIEESLGSFVQYPIRLAWAVTVHKSQGLTFQKAIVDLGESFAPGQVYVALSRCTSLQGLVLRSRIPPGSISTDEQVMAFAKKEDDEGSLRPVLEQEKRQYLSDQLVRLFDFEKLKMVMNDHIAFLPGKKVPDENEAMQAARRFQSKILELDEVAEKFRPQLSKLLEEADQKNESKLLVDRVQKAIVYFSKELTDGLLAPLNGHINAVGRKTKKYRQQLRLVKAAIVRKLENMKRAKYNDVVLSDGGNFANLEKENESLSKEIIAHKREKGVSHKETMVLYREGLSISEISKRRGLAPTTIEGHLASFIKTGELDVHELVSAEKLPVIMQVLDQMNSYALTPVKERLGNKYSYAEIKAAVNYKERLKELAQISRKE